MTDHHCATNRKTALCGQAHAVLDTLERAGNLPVTLSLSIEEIIEHAWEDAYRKPFQPVGGTVIHLLRS